MSFFFIQSVRWISIFFFSFISCIDNFYRDQFCMWVYFIYQKMGGICSPAFLFSNFQRPKPCWKKEILNLSVYSNIWHCVSACLLPYASQGGRGRGWSSKQQIVNYIKILIVNIWWWNISKQNHKFRLKFGLEC